MDLREFYMKWWYLFGIILAILWWMGSISAPFSRMFVNLLFYLYLGISLLLFGVIKTYLVKKDGKIFSPTKWDVIIGLVWSLSFILIERTGLFYYLGARGYNLWYLWFPFKIWGGFFKKIFHITRGEDWLFLAFPLLLLGILTSIFVVYVARVIIEKVRG